ncbi:glycosyltransferase family 2 protein [Arthrobacter echini]|uniref:Glycosyltransferase family 2 protein n=1 Tax=Arthrobacter echini TaxID=1529066 RepID=A0A4S5E856_9MICC|nr:glycosyltransferase family 2 protein [Arthrobacter echini]THJ67841.1 glycosyltransferase family 2 protein [Arthrobacter echini]
MTAHPPHSGTSLSLTSVQGLRKALKRIRNRALWSYLRVRNVVDRSPVIGDAPLVVSLTTYGDRVGAAAVAIESIARGRIKPSRIVLWMDDAVLYEERPAALRRLEGRGLEIRLSENYGPHTKYYPFVRSQREHQLPLVTADDDIMYPQDWLNRLYEAYELHPSSINCHWASRILLTGEHLASYHTWPNCTDTTPGFSNFGLGVSGVIYPPAMLTALAARGAAFRELSPTADDVWLHWTALRSRIPVRQISPVPRHFALIPGTQGRTLMSTNNVEGSGNDTWIRGLYSEGDRSTIADAFSVEPA